MLDSPARDEAAQGASPRPGLRSLLLAPVVASAGGALGIVGAFVQELQSGGIGILLAFAGAPIIEEALKPAGVYLLLARWPQALAGRLHTAVLTALAGVTFGIIESLVYVALYFPERGDAFVLYRFTVPVFVHGLASFTVGLGLSRGLIDWAAGRRGLPKAARAFYIAGVGLHAAYNLTAIILALTGVFDFD